MMLKNKRVVLIVCGSIAAYKSVELLRELTKRGASVQVVMSESAKAFVGELTFQTLSHHPVRSSVVDSGEEAQIGHIEIADQADLVIVAPATADLLARAAQGAASDLASAVILATKAPVLIVPAMNVNMWTHPLTQRNVATLQEVGYRFIDPVAGDLACGWTGVGRLAEVPEIVDEVEFLLSDQDLSGTEVIVTASTTREPLDPIRYVANRSSGRMGFAIAQDARRRGARVTLISGPTVVRTPRGVGLTVVETAQQMHDEVFAVLSKSPGPEIKKRLVFMVAAVADHRPAEFSEKKLKNEKTKEYTIRMAPNPDILREIGERRKELEKTAGVPLRLIGFAAETGTDEELLQSAREKLKRKKADLIVGNIAQHSFDRENTRVWLIDREGAQEEIALADKTLVGRRILTAAMKL